jgi:hypothetical protein
LFDLNLKFTLIDQSQIRCIVQLSLKVAVEVTKLLIQILEIRAANALTRGIVNRIFLITLSNLTLIFVAEYDIIEKLRRILPLLPDQIHQIVDEC